MHEVQRVNIKDQASIDVAANENGDGKQRSALYRLLSIPRIEQHQQEDDWKQEEKSGHGVGHGSFHDAWCHQQVKQQDDRESQDQIGKGTEDSRSKHPEDGPLTFALAAPGSAME